MNNILDAVKLCSGYGHLKVIHDVDLYLKKGETVFIVGRNGAGKTTLLKTIAGLIRPFEGKVIYDGFEITQLPPEEIARKGIRFVAQDKKVFSSLSVRANLELAAWGSKVSLDEVIKRTLSIYPQMEKFLDLPAKGLSGGQREILLIERAIATSPRLLMIDEPTEGLAAIVVNEIKSILESMKGDLSSIIVEQNLALVSALADRIYIMKEGKILKELSDTQEIRDQDYLESLL